MHAFLQSQDLFGIVDGTVARPTPANAAAPTPDQRAAIAAWDTAVVRALGNITLRVTPQVHLKIEMMNAPDAWTELQRLYGTVSPSQVFESFKRTVLFRLNITKPICPQMDHLDGWYSALVAEHASAKRNLPYYALLCLTGPIRWYKA